MERTHTVFRFLSLSLFPIIAFSLISLSSSASASTSSSSSLPYYGASFSTILFGKEPTHLHGFQFMLVYDPNLYKWNHFNVYFDGGFSHLWDAETSYYSTVNIYSIAPVLRYTFPVLYKVRHNPHPYLDISVGLAYLNHTHFEDRKLGIHFAFQDRIGIGVYFGNQNQLSIGLHAVHYSNAHLSGHNSGITAPVVLDIGYRFQ